MPQWLRRLFGLNDRPPQMLPNHHVIDELQSGLQTATQKERRLIAELRRIERELSRGDR